MVLKEDHMPEEATLLQIEAVAEIVSREEYLARLHSTVQKTELSDLVELLNLIRRSALSIVKLVVKWRNVFGDETKAFIWQGKNYLVMMLSDLNFLADIKSVCNRLGLASKRLKFNPFMSAYSLLDENSQAIRSVNLSGVIDQVGCSHAEKTDVEKEFNVQVEEVVAAEKILIREIRNEDLRRITSPQVANNDMPSIDSWIEESQDKMSRLASSWGLPRVRNEMVKHPKMNLGKMKNHPKRLFTKSGSVHSSNSSTKKHAKGRLRRTNKLVPLCIVDDTIQIPRIVTHCEGGVPFYSISASGLLALGQQVQPSTQVALSVAAALILLAPGNAVPNVMRWDALAETLVTGNGLTAFYLLKRFNHTCIPKFKIQAILPFLTDSRFSPDSILPVNETAAGLCAWVIQVATSMRKYRKWTKITMKDTTVTLPQQTETDDYSEENEFEGPESEKLVEIPEFEREVEYTIGFRIWTFNKELPTGELVTLSFFTTNTPVGGCIIKCYEPVSSSEAALQFPSKQLRKASKALQCPYRSTDSANLVHLCKAISGILMVSFSPELSLSLQPLPLPLEKEWVKIMGTTRQYGGKKFALSVFANGRLKSMADQVLLFKARNVRVTGLAIEKELDYGQMQFILRDCRYLLSSRVSEELALALISKMKISESNGIESISFLKAYTFKRPVFSPSTSNDLDLLRFGVMDALQKPHLSDIHETCISEERKKTQRPSTSFQPVRQSTQCAKKQFNERPSTNSLAKRDKSSKSSPDISATAQTLDNGNTKATLATEISHATEVSTTVSKPEPNFTEISCKPEDDYSDDEDEYSTDEIPPVVEEKETCGKNDESILEDGLSDPDDQVEVYSEVEKEGDEVHSQDNVSEKDSEGSEKYTDDEEDNLSDTKFDDEEEYLSDIKFDDKEDNLSDNKLVDEEDKSSENNYDDEEENFSENDYDDDFVGAEPSTANYDEEHFE